MSNQRRQFMALAAGAIAVPATSSLVLAQGNPSRGREAPIPAPVPERRSAKSELTGLSALLTPEECVVVLIDHQPFQFANLHSHEPTMIVNNVIGLAKFAKAFKVPVILTTVLEARGGRIIKGLQDVFPDQKPVDRTYINTWQDKRVDVHPINRLLIRKYVLKTLYDSSSASFEHRGQNNRNFEGLGELGESNHVVDDHRRLVTVKVRELKRLVID